MNDLAVHMAHCNQGEYLGSCCYGEPEDCPALELAQRRIESGENLERHELRGKLRFAIEQADLTTLRQMVTLLGLD